MVSSACHTKQICREQMFIWSNSSLSVYFDIDIYIQYFYGRVCTVSRNLLAVVINTHWLKLSKCLDRVNDLTQFPRYIYNNIYIYIYIYKYNFTWFLTFCTRQFGWWIKWQSLEQSNCFALLQFVSTQCSWWASTS